MMRIIQKYSSWVLLLFTVAMSACGGGSGDGPASVSPPDTPGAATPLKGVFVDATVEGIKYSTASQSGLTNADGTFLYELGESVTFSIGGIVFGSTIATPLITPLQLVAGATNANDPAVTNIIRLLLTLDADNNPDNGIQITPEVASAAANLSVDFAVPTADFSSSESNPDLAGLLTAASSTLVGVATAQQHFNLTLAGKAGVWGSSNWAEVFWQK